MTKIYKNNFVQQHATRNIDLEKVGQNADAQAQLAENGVSMSRLRQADRNGDGVVSPAEAFRVADHFDRDGNANSLISHQGANRPAGTSAQPNTQAGRAATVLGMMLQRDDLQGTPQRGENDDIVFVGMGTETRYSAGAKHEIRELNKVTNGEVVGIMDSKAGNDKIRVGGQTYDLATPEGRTGFTQTLGLPEEQSNKIADVLASVGNDGKDEVAQLAQVWARGEQGEAIPSRMVLSGHHVGSAVWGDGNGRITWDDLKDLSEAMPNAASQVKDLHLSACYSGGEAKFDKYRGIFPNVKTVWAYSGSAPGTGSGATHHQAAWERATRGGGTDIAGTAENLQARGWRKAENITTTTFEGSTYNGPALGELRSTLEGQEATFENFFTGQSVVENSQHGPLRDYYNDIQAALAHPDLPAGERQNLEERRDQTIRALFYQSHIAHRFDDAYGSQIQSGFEAMGMDVPHFNDMNRQEGMEVIRNFREQVESNPNAPQAAQDLLPTLNGLWNLDSQVIPETWI
ncbi:MAG: hypothetical protein EP343_08585 [Deltaproteobacteria bacterium]|nr:MAG: hypothetical protein EP343_08585 [Deltaproteobacteria bacterium]